MQPLENLRPQTPAFQTHSIPLNHQQIQRLDSDLSKSLPQSQSSFWSTNQPNPSA